MSSSQGVQRSVTNNNAFDVSSLEAIVSLYDEWGNVLNAASAAATPPTVASNGTATYSVPIAHNFAGWNGRMIQFEAAR